MSINNTNYGLDSLINNSGKDNTAFGAYSLYNNLDPSNNTAVGSNSLFYNTTGSNNTAIGAGSICNNTTGKLNTALGSSSLEGSIAGQSVGDQNVAVGVTTLFNNTGNLNTALGAYSGLAHTDGSHNTFLGANTDVSNNTITYANSTALGYNAKIGASNQIKMGGLNSQGAYPDVLIPGTGHFEQYTPGLYDNLSIVPKIYVDTVATGIRPQRAVAAATATGENINGIYNNAGVGTITGLSTPLTIDGVLIQDGSAVLLKDQSIVIQNGVYIQSTGTLTRRSGMQTGDDAAGAYVFVLGGNTNAFSAWVASNIDGSNVAIVGTDGLVFTQLNSFNYKIGQGLNTTTGLDGDTYLNVDSSLNFIQYLDNTAGPVPGTMYIGTNTTNINIGNATSITTIDGSANFSRISFPSNKVKINGSTNQVNQGANAVAIGQNAGQTNQGQYAVAIGNDAGNNSQGQYAVAIGTSAGFSSQGQSAVAIGIQAGRVTQGANAVAIGSQAGFSSQGEYAVAIGFNAGQFTQGESAVALGDSAGSINQGIHATAVGGAAGQTNQGEYAVAIGFYAGTNAQGTQAVAIGNDAGQNTQGQNAVAIGFNTGQNNQGANAVAIGQNAGTNTQGQYAIAIGSQAGSTNQPANSIVINASGSLLNGATQSAFYANPVRLNNANTAGNMLNYNTTTSEISYTSNIVYNNGNVGIGTITPNSLLHVSGNTSNPNTNSLLKIVNTDTTSNNTELRITPGLKQATATANYVTYDIPGTGVHYFWDSVEIFSSCSATTFNTTSDYRIKENIQLLNDTYNIDNLKPSTYFNTKLGKQDIGLIAHELQEIYPELVTGEKDGEELQSINYIGLIPILIKEIQDLKKKLNSTF